MRGYRQRCAERLERLRRRVTHLSERIARQPAIDCVYDKQERSALLWAIEEIERWETVAAILSSAESDAEKVARLSSVLRSRLRPSVADLARTPSLARQFAQTGDRP